MSIYKKVSTLNCPECGIEFQTANRRQKYCTAECRKARNKRAYKQSYSRERIKRSVVREAACESCNRQFSYVLYEQSKPRRFCSRTCHYAQRNLERSCQPRCVPNGRLSRADLAVIELIWHAYDFSPLGVFLGKRNVVEIFKCITSKAMFYEWVVYTIIFQAHLTHRYESIIQIPGLKKVDFLKLCRKFNITLKDSEAFDSDMKSFG
ncbi:MAG: hypothetical protein OXN17_08205 [Candidatus Poribacteria bacterium]|nr:hypothetical protein [Candidatus Poribacteria bacterium]MDE0505333.1 hypothetical protein [Candidatus Poribacteria bacterium]